MSNRNRIVITGMSINTPLGDRLDVYLERLLAGHSAVTKWKALDTSRIYSKVGGDLSGYDIAGKVASLQGRVPADVYKRLRKLACKSPWSTALTMLMSLDACIDARLYETGVDFSRAAAIVAGHNINFNYQYTNRLQFAEEPDFMDGLLALTGLDTDHAGCISEVLGILGPIYTVGAACASANTALRCAVDEIRYHDADVALVAGAVLDFSPVELHAMALMGAITFQSFNDAPEQASRPYDTRREGFVPVARRRRAGDRIAGTRAPARRQHLRRGHRCGSQLGRQPPSPAIGGRAGATDAAPARQVRHAAAADRLHQRARHLHAAGRCYRNPRPSNASSAATPRASS